MKKTKKTKKTRNMWIKIAKVLKVSGLIIFSIVWVFGLAFFFLIASIFRIPIEDYQMKRIRQERAWRQYKISIGADPTFNEYGRLRY